MTTTWIPVESSLDSYYDESSDEVVDRYTEHYRWTESGLIWRHTDPYTGRQVKVELKGVRGSVERILEAHDEELMAAL